MFFISHLGISPHFPFFVNVQWVFPSLRSKTQNVVLWFLQWVLFGEKLKERPIECLHQQKKKSFLHELPPTSDVYLKITPHISFIFTRGNMSQYLNKYICMKF